MSRRSEQQLHFDAFKAGDEKALRYFIELYEYSLLLFIMKIVTNSEGAEELTSELFIRMWKNRETLDNPAHLRNWLYITARNMSLYFLRDQLAEEKGKRDLQRHYEEEARIPAIKMMENAILDEIFLRSEDLPEERRLIFLLHYFKNYKRKEIAKVLKISLSTVKYNLDQAVIYLRGKVGKKDFLPAFLLLFSAISKIFLK